MTIEELVDQMTLELPSNWKPQACTEEDIAKADIRFSERYDVAFPEAYKRVLRRANGVLHNGLTIWPISSQAGFRQTIFEANDDLRDTFDERFVYFGQRDEELYVYEISKKRYVAIEFVGKPVWKDFDGATQMFQLMLERAFG